MSKILVVFGATGNQGGSIVDYVLNDPTLSKEYTIRAVTRNPESSSAQALKSKEVEVVKGDASDVESLKAVMKDSHTVFGLSVTEYDGKEYERELDHGKSIANAAVAAGAQYIIWSTLPHVKNISGGKYTKVGGFDSKAEVEAYIRTLSIKSAFFAPGSFMQNFHTGMIPRPLGNGDYGIFMPTTPQTERPFIDIGDTGKWVGAILAEPEKYEGKRFAAATKLSSMDEVASIISKATGKTVRYVQVSPEDFVKFLPPAMGEPLCEMLLYQQDFGYYGPNTKEEVEWAAANARGKLTTLEEYFQRVPLKLD